MIRSPFVVQVNRIFHAFSARFSPAPYYVKRNFLQKTGVRLNLKEPITFSEKLQWLKLYYRHPEMPRIADKYEVKSFVKQKLGEDRSVETAALFNRADEIKLKDLPEAFALKATHGSGWNIISFNKEEVNESDLRKYFSFWLRKSYYTYSKEWAYKKINPRVICEPLLIDSKGDLPFDYKVFCFSGKATFIQVDVDRFSSHTRVFYDRFWKKQEFTIGYPLYSSELAKPDCLHEMLSIAEVLSQDFPFLRVDFYINEGHVYIGELTFYPGNGMEVFSSDDWNVKLGNMLELPSDNYCN